MSTNIGRLDFSTFTFLTFAQAYNAVLNYMSLEADLLTEYLIDVIVERKYSFGRKIIPSCINTVQSALKDHLNVQPSSLSSAACLFFWGCQFSNQKEWLSWPKEHSPSLRPELVLAGSLR